MVARFGKLEMVAIPKMVVLEWAAAARRCELAMAARLKSDSGAQCTMDEWSTHEFGEWEGENAVRTNAHRSEIVQWSKR